MLHAKKDRVLEYQQRQKSLNGLTWEALMKAALVNDARFLQVSRSLFLV